MNSITKYSIICLALLALGCKAETKDAPKATEAVEQSTTPPVANSKTDSPPSAPVQKTASTQISGKGATDDGKNIKVLLSISGQNAVSGEFSFDGKQLKIKGIKDKETLRCWIGNGADAAEVWMGTLIATIENKTYSGTFALSDNGAANTLRGTWKSDS